MCQGVRGGCHGLGLVMEPILVGHEILRYLHRPLCMSCLVELAALLYWVHLDEAVAED